MKDDPAITRIRETRHRISEVHDHDAQRVVAYYIELQKKYKQRLPEDSQREEDRAPSVKA